MTEASYAELATSGFCVVDGVLQTDEVERFRGDVAVSAGRGGARNLLDIASVRSLVESPCIRDLCESVLGRSARVVRGILFDKTPDANWKVPWHQDVTIAVAERMEQEGFGPWSVKAGVVHVQAPAAVLERMLTLRIHLDSCSSSNGPLRVIPGTHLLGKIGEGAIAGSIAGATAKTCEVGVGGVLLMRPLLVHGSSAAEVPGHRRVIHLDFAEGGLLTGLRWAIP